MLAGTLIARCVTVSRRASNYAFRNNNASLDRQDALLGLTELRRKKLFFLDARRDTVTHRATAYYQVYNLPRRALSNLGKLKICISITGEMHRLSSLVAR